MSSAVHIPMPITPDAASIGMLLEGFRQLGIAIQEIKEYRDQKGHVCPVDMVIKTQAGEEIGVVKTATGMDFVVAHPERKAVQDTIGQVKQVYSRLKILNAVKAKGYSQVKEEKLADGSIRLVVQKWRPSSK
ncbi:MAG: DUF1257 domain-containing protein [Bdellovibrionota bacterium]